MGGAGSPHSPASAPAAEPGGCCRVRGLGAAPPAVAGPQRLSGRAGCPKKGSSRSRAGVVGARHAAAFLREWPAPPHAGTGEGAVGGEPRPQGTRGAGLGQAARARGSARSRPRPSARCASSPTCPAGTCPAGEAGGPRQSWLCAAHGPLGAGLLPEHGVHSGHGAAHMVGPGGRHPLRRLLTGTP